MGKKRKTLSHAEIWDDSALVQSWDEALEEYKLYHSIHARGERMSDAISDFQRQGDLHRPNGDNDQKEDGEQNENDFEEGEVEDAKDGADDDRSEPQVAYAETGHHHVDTVNEGSSDPGKIPKMNGTSGESGVEGTPTAGPGSVLYKVQDDSLKNAMMAWYWAGYYTGLHEGQQEGAKAYPSKSTGN